MTNLGKKFPIAVHALLIMVRFDGTDKATSAQIAQSTGANAVIIRNIFGELKQAGLVEATAGKNGGVCLAQPAKDISLWDVYTAVETDNVDEIFKFHESSGQCLVGKNVYQLMTPHMNDALDAMKKELERVSIDALRLELLDMLDKQSVQEETACASH